MMARVLFASSATLAAAALVLRLAPPPSADISGQTKSANAAPQPSPDLARFSHLFDLSKLPPPQLKRPDPVAIAPAPPPDPAEAIRLYRFIGLAVSGTRSVGVFTNDAATVVLAAGGSLEAFTLQGVSEDGASFTNADGVAVILPLNRAGDG